MSGVPQTRIYLPLTLARLSTLRDARQLPAPVTAYAVVAPAARARDTDELEHAAWLAAATAARDLVGDGRRVVASADVEADTVAVVSEPYPVVEVAAPLLLRQVASFHIDEEPGGADADLLWYDVTEIDEVARLAGG